MKDAEEAKKDVEEKERKEAEEKERQEAEDKKKAEEEERIKAEEEARAKVRYCAVYSLTLSWLSDPLVSCYSIASCIDFCF